MILVDSEYHNITSIKIPAYLDDKCGYYQQDNRTIENI